MNKDSIDSIPKILNSYANKDSRIKVLKDSNNETLYACRIKGIKETKYKRLPLMDADDECHLDRIQK